MTRSAGGGVVRRDVGHGTLHAIRQLHDNSASDSWLPNDLVILLT